MNSMRMNVVRWGSLLLGLASLAYGQPPCRPYDPPACTPRPIDLVICLDTSCSMNGLIDSARARLWDIVNELGKVRPTPQLRVGLLTYGSPSVSTAGTGWVVKRSDLTDDLDSIYAKMMPIRTDGGDEFVGWVLNDAVYSMNWSNNPNALKIIFVAGNESADQATTQYNFRSVAVNARERGITVNAIYCGNHDQGVREAWNSVAQCGGGSYTSIDMACGTTQTSTPYDQKIIDLNIQLNATYVPYGQAGEASRGRQAEMDGYADRQGKDTAATRVLAKSQSSVYQNSGWDLVDASAKADFRLEEVAVAELPPPMQAMTIEQRRAYVEDQRQDRVRVQQQIQGLAQEREGYVRAERMKKKDGKVSLDDAILQSLREQAQSKGFEFEGKK
ncbi:MAG: vWA domain-containing protein [Planctomycetota bacterium]